MQSRPAGDQQPAKNNPQTAFRIPHPAYRVPHTAKRAIVFLLTLLIVFINSGLPATMGFLWAGYIPTDTAYAAENNKLYFIHTDRVKLRHAASHLLSLFSTNVFAAEEGLYFVHSDHLGSTTVITDEAGEVVNQQQRHYPYGTDRINADLTRIPTERSFTGQIKDRSTALHYYNARYYDPTLATFTSADTMGQGFAYASASPIMNTDPTGHMVVHDGGGGGQPASNIHPYSAQYMDRYDPQQMAWEDFKVENPSYDITWEEFMRDLESPWYLRQTPQGKFFGDVYDIGKGLAFGAALYGANALVAKGRIKLAQWRMRPQDKIRFQSAEDIIRGMERRGASISYDPNLDRYEGYHTIYYDENLRVVSQEVVLSENPDLAAVRHEAIHLYDDIELLAHGVEPGERAFGMDKCTFDMFLESRAYEITTKTYYEEWGRTGDPALYNLYEQSLADLKWASQFPESSGYEYGLKFPWE